MMTTTLNKDFFTIDNALSSTDILDKRLPVTVVPTHKGKFEPKFLHELFDSLYGNIIKEAKDLFWEQILNEEAARGSFWEKVLEKHMLFTKRHAKRNQIGSDFLDFTEGKFAGGARYSADGTVQATIGGVENKTGTLRVCLCAWGQHSHKVYFMLIPYEEYSTWKSPAKITLRANSTPIGPLWDKYQCSFQDVIRQGV
jgi:hypothetical protein